MNIGGGDSWPKWRGPRRTLHASCSERESQEQSELMCRLLDFKVLLQYWDILNPSSCWQDSSILAEAALREANGAYRPRAKNHNRCYVLFTASYYRTYRCTIGSPQTLTPPLPISLHIRGPKHTYTCKITKLAYFLLVNDDHGEMKKNIFAVLC